VAGSIGSSCRATAEVISVSTPAHSNFGRAAHSARTGFFKPIHVKSLSAHAVIARKNLVGQRVTLENQIRGLAVVFGVRLPRALTAAFIQRALACAAALAQGPRRPRDLTADIPDAPKILHGNVYGWFVPVGRGVYTLAESRFCVGRSRRRPPCSTRHLVAYEERPQSKGSPVRSVIDSMPMSEIADAATR
jgi:Putative PD-(D/E)XK phosphodiesterase (DUF2161)